jgi:ATP-binding cassette subfamily F protein uup
VLDEPTNDLDLETLDLLQEVIADYDGTVLIVSHDRDFLDKHGDGDLGPGWLRPGRYRRGRLCRLGEATQQPNAAPKKAAPKAEAAPPPPPKAAKLSYKDQRDFDLLPKRIEELETAITRDEAALADPDLYAKNPTRFAALMAAIEKARAEKDAAEERWLELAEMAEEMGR